MKTTKFLASLLMIIACFLLETTSAFASHELPTNISENTTTIYINNNTFAISRTETQEFETFFDSLAEKLTDVQVSEYDNVIEKHFTSNVNTMYEKVLNFIKDNSTNNSNTYLNVSEEFVEEYKKTYNLGNNTLLIVTPTYFIIDVLTDVSDKNINRETASKSGTTKQTGYGLLGNKLFDLSVTCTFYYDGSSAWYKSGFDYYYTRGILSLWQVSNWRGWKESNGTSYNAYCAGNFHFGLEYDGIGLVIQDVYCKNIITCSKSGTLISSYE